MNEKFPHYNEQPENSKNEATQEQEKTSSFSYLNAKLDFSILKSHFDWHFDIWPLIHQWANLSYSSIFLLISIHSFASRDEMNELANSVITKFSADSYPLAFFERIIMSLAYVQRYKNLFKFYFFPSFPFLLFFIGLWFVSSFLWFFFFVFFLVFLSYFETF